MPIQSINPATGETLCEFNPLTSDEIEHRLARAERAFASYSRSPFAARAELLRNAAAILRRDEEAHARTITLEMGKPIRAAREEVRKCATVCDYYSEHGAELLRPNERKSGAARGYVRCDPLGTILAIMPWNFPYWQVFRFAAPALMAGSAGLLKHAGNVPQCALGIEQVFLRAGFPAGLFQTLLIEAEQTGAVIDDPRVKAVTLTGSDRAGAEVASRAARAIKKSVLELGGSDPFIVMPSADLTAAAEIGVKSRTINAGQSCIAAKRFIVAEAVFEEYVALFVEKMQALRVGDPLDESTEVGPLATASIRRSVEEQVQKTVAAGAELSLGGKRLDRPGFFYEPTVLLNVPRDSAAAREEVFGPVAAFFRVRDRDEALALANDSAFGLGATAWTNDPGEQEFLARELEAGLVFINAMVASDPCLPFGGVKRSGYGRELSAEGIREFVNLKTVVVAPG